MENSDDFNSHRVCIYHNRQRYGCDAGSDKHPEPWQRQQREPRTRRPGQDSSSAVEGAVRIVDNAGNNSYSPNPIEAKVGETVTWVNDDSAIHTATSIDGIFDSDILQRGQTFSYTFDKEGEYQYYCALHPNMVGTVSVS